MKTAFLFLLLLVANFCIAQKFDRNWVFGKNAGIYFDGNSNPIVFKPKIVTDERAGNISDSLGELLFYLTGDEFRYANIADLDDNLIENGDSLIADDSESSGAIILPSYDASNFLIFHLGSWQTPDCPNPTCVRLFFTVVKSENGIPKVINKNINLLNIPLFEKVAAVKHANGKDWWLIAHTEFDSTLNRFYKFLITDTIINGPYYQDIGVYVGGFLDRQGEIKFSMDGNLLGLIRGGTKVYEVYNFNRCTGVLTEFKRGQINTPQKTYGLEFSKSGRYLYISSFDTQPSAKIYQIDLLGSQIIEVASSQYTFAQMQIAPDERIYVANKCFPVSSEFILPCNQYLGRINFPDSAGIACDFQINSIYLGDSSQSTYALPDMPNYNLGATTIYQADAGEDTITICTEDTTVKGVLLGVTAVSGVTYSWQGDSLNHTNIAQPFASPAATTWYYVTLTDTSIKYSCQSRTDSVLVEVRDCSVGVESPQSTVNSPQIKIYPNPTEGMLHVELLHNKMALHRIEMTDLSGKRVLQQETPLIAQPATLNTHHLAKGLYFVKVELSGGQSVVQKVMVR